MFNKNKFESYKTEILVYLNSLSNFFYIMKNITLVANCLIAKF